MFEQVPTPTSILQAILSLPLTQRGFEQIGPQKWVRSTKEAIRELVVLIRGKGGGLSPAWGFSLDFVPHIAASKVRWHRTPKSALLDLRYDPVDYDVQSLPGPRWWDPAVRGVDRSREAARKVLAQAETFFAGVRTIADLPEAFEAKRRRRNTRFGLLNYVQEPMAYAFTLARLGRQKDAVEWLTTAADYHQLEAIESQKLRRAFDALLAAS